MENRNGRGMDIENVQQNSKEKFCILALSVSVTA